VHVVPNAVDVDWWRQRPVSAPAYPGEVVVTTLGRISPRKRPLPLLRVMHRVRRQVGADVPLRLVVAGDGPQLGRLRREVRMLGMDDWVDLPGRLTPQQSRDLLHSSDVYVAPADLESFGIAALEARTVGLPVVAKSCGGVGEFVTHGTEGLLVGDDDDLVAAIVALVTDPGLRQRIAAHNTVVPPRTTWEQALEGAENLYRQAALVAGRRVAKREVVG
jgi:phosphatidylinositol alpha 1,6-mannosyltransferase